MKRLAQLLRPRGRATACLFSSLSPSPEFCINPPARPVRDPNDPPRTIDVFYEKSYASTAGRHSYRLGFWAIFLSLGVANSGDATELGVMNFILSDLGFQNEILGGGDFSGRGATVRNQRSLQTAVARFSVCPPLCDANFPLTLSLIRLRAHSVRLPAPFSLECW